MVDDLAQLGEVLHGVEMSLVLVGVVLRHLLQLVDKGLVPHPKSYHRDAFLLGTFTKVHARRDKQGHLN